MGAGDLQSSLRLGSAPTLGRITQQSEPQLWAKWELLNIKQKSLDEKEDKNSILGSNEV